MLIILRHMLIRLKKFPRRWMKWNAHHCDFAFLFSKSKWYEWKFQNLKTQNYERGDGTESDGYKRRSFAPAGASVVLTFFTVVEVSTILRHNSRDELGITGRTPVNVFSTIHLQWQILNFFAFYLLITICCRPDVCSFMLGQLEFFYNRALRWQQRSPSVP